MECLISCLHAFCCRNKWLCVVRAESRDEIVINVNSEGILWLTCKHVSKSRNTTNVVRLCCCKFSDGNDGNCVFWVKEIDVVGDNFVRFF